MEKRLYEILIALDPAVLSPDADALMARLGQQIADSGGEVKSMEKHGLRKLAYRVRGKTEANFFQFVCEAPPGMVQQVKQILRLHEGILRAMTTKIDPHVISQSGAAGK